MSEEHFSRFISYEPFIRFFLGVSNAPFFYPLKTSENFQGVEKGCIENKWVTYRASLEALNIINL